MNPERAAESVPVRSKMYLCTWRRRLLHADHGCFCVLARGIRFANGVAACSDTRNDWERIREDMTRMMMFALLVIGGSIGCSGVAEDGELFEEEVGEQAQELARWTGYVSEESTSPATCSYGRAAVGFECAGAFCDRIRMRCDDLPGAIPGYSSWSPWFEHDGRNAYVCPGDEWITGIQCWGDYCDNISIRCTSMQVWAEGGANWHYPSGKQGYSEEDRPFISPAGRFIAGIRCWGTYCDEKAYITYAVAR